MTGQHARVEAIEPARSDIVPGTVLRNDMIMNAIAAGRLKRTGGDLIHADGTRGRLVPFERIPRCAPAPVRSGDRVAAPFDLSQRGEQFRRDDGRGMFPKERAVVPPGLSEGFVE